MAQQATQHNFGPAGQATESPDKVSRGSGIRSVLHRLYRQGISEHCLGCLCYGSLHSSSSKSSYRSPYRPALHTCSSGTYSNKKDRQLDKPSNSSLISSSISTRNNSSNSKHHHCLLALHPKFKRHLKDSSLGHLSGRALKFFPALKSSAT